MFSNDGMQKTTGKKNAYITLFIVIVLAVTAYSAYWFIASKEVKKVVLKSIEDQRKVGYQVEHYPIKISGYPYRFIVDIEKPSVIAPENEWSWQAEKVQLVMQSYNFSHYIGFAPGNHSLTTSKLGTITADTDGLKASLKLKKGDVNQISIVANSLIATDENNQTTRLDKPNLHIAPMPEDQNDMRILVGFDFLQLPAPLPDVEFLGTDVGPVSAPIVIKKGMKLPDYEDFPTFASMENPQIISPLTQIKWGALDLKLKTKELSLDYNNMLKGELSLRLDDVQALENAISGSPLFNEKSQMALMAAKATFNNEETFMPIQFSDGQAKFLNQKIADLEPIY